MKFGPFIIILFIVAGLYLLPSVLAKFAGTHTAEVNRTAGPEELDCIPCHTYVLEELNNTYATSVTQKHRDAAGNDTYTLSWLGRNLSSINQSNEGVCYLCHAVIKDYENESHTGVSMRVCTDLNCHGTNQTTNNTFYPSGNASIALSGQNVHESWIDGLSSSASKYTNETGSNYTRDYFTCLGCHTYVDVEIETTRAIYNHSNSSATTNRYI